MIDLGNTGDTTDNNACASCGDICCLISNDCVCRYTTLKHIDLSNYPDLVEQANRALEAVSECDLCEGFGTDEYQYQDLIDHKHFKAYYAQLIKYFWAIDYGYGIDGPKGKTIAVEDEFSDYKNIRPDLSREREKCESYSATFLETFKTLFPNCFNCIEEKNSECGCNGNCRCNKNEDYNLDDTRCF